MAEERIKRRLAAILAADVVGYSRLMGIDEVGTLAALRAVWAERLDPAVASHHGRIVKMMGDGALVEFASVVDAVDCGVAFQRAMVDHNAARPGEEPIEFRIGINLGDIMIDGDDIVGDGVNVAARLESQAPRNGILLSDAAHTQIRGKVGADFTEAGEFMLKNIAAPVRAWRWSPGTAAAVPAAAASDKRPGIVVLPLDNMSGDAEQAYFSDGIAEDIITDLSKLSGLLVIARNSAFAYRGANRDLRAVTRELGVRYALEGSVRKAGNRVRITAQLIDGVDGGHLWAERYDRDLTDIFAVQDDVTRHIVQALALVLSGSEGLRLGRRGTANLDAYDAYLRGRDLAARYRRAETHAAQALFERAVALDPSFAAALARLALTHQVEYRNNWSADPAASRRQARELAQRAIALDKLEPDAHYANGVVAMYDGQPEASIAAARKVLELDPNSAAAHALLGRASHYIGHNTEALDHLQQATRLDPHYPDAYLHFLGQAYFALGRYEEAMTVLRQRIARYPDTDISRVLLAACLGHLGRAGEASEAWREALRVNPAFSLEKHRHLLPYRDSDTFERIVSGLAKAGCHDQPATDEAPAPMRPLR